MAKRYPITIVGYIVADSEDEAILILDDVAGAGVNIEKATSDGEVWWDNEMASGLGYVDD